MKPLLIAISSFLLVAAAPGPDEIMDDPALEQRAMSLYDQLRCVVCQSQSIGSSDAPLAVDMRLVVRERLLAGDDDRAVLGYMQERYGDYVLMRPPLQANTLLLWGMPFIFVIGGVLLAFRYVRAQDKPGETLSKTDQAKADALMKEEGLE
ncbi:cytochrome c-type biogenesis protein [Maricaulis sp. MIT060901]|uniref:cytochrome c-type biogenesis protein n=1 Tax=Maricaulis sp. MIT060901 TaxID=3096993 RepID=UPI00399A953D